MSTKQKARNEILKFKTLTDNTTTWARRIVKFWNSTEDVCTTVIGMDSTALKNLSEIVLQEVKKLSDLAATKCSEFNKQYSEKSKTKKEVNFEELSKNIATTTSEISTTIVRLLQIQSEQFEQLFTSSMQRQMKYLSESSPFNSIALDTAESLEVAKRDASSDENNIELDWDAFDRDLAAMTEAVGKLSPDQAESEEVMKLKRQVKGLQKENLELIRKAILSEHALGSMEKQQETDDFEELRKALKQEQISRMEAEQKLKDAQEEIKAAKFAYKVAKAVANKIADTACLTKDSVEILDRNDSAFCRRSENSSQLLTQETNQEQLPPAHLSHQDPSAGNKLSLQNQTVTNEMSHQKQTVINEMSHQKQSVANELSHQKQSVGNELSHRNDNLDTNPFLDMSHHDTVGSEASVEISQKDTNPFLLSDQDPVVCMNLTPDEKEQESNPFLVDILTTGKSLTKQEVVEETDSNPFLTPKPVAKPVEKTSEIWNPFASSSSSSSNPFLS